MRNQRFWFFVFLVVLFIGLLIFNEVRWRFEEGDVLNIALLPEAKYGEDWEKLIAGASQAANEMGAELTVLAPDYARTYQEQLNLIETARLQGSDGIIIAPGNAQAIGDALLEVKDSGTQVLCVVKDVDYIGSIASIKSDQYEIGVRLGEMVIETFGSNVTVAYIRPSVDSTYLDQREIGLREYLASYEEVQLIGVYPSRDDVYSAADKAAALEIVEAPDVIVALNRTMTQGAAEAVSVGRMDAKVLGTDLTDGFVAFMDDGIISGVVAQDYFSMGYLAVREMIDSLKSNQSPGEVAVKTYKINYEDLYSKDIQMIFFKID